MQGKLEFDEKLALLRKCQHGQARFCLDACDGRRALRDPRVWAAVAIGALAWLPLLLWNLHNADAGLRFQLLDRHPWSFSGEGLRLGRMQLLLATPILLVAMALAAMRGLRNAGPGLRYLASCGAMIVLGFLALGFFADRERVSFHWPLPGYLALLPLVPAVLARWARGWRVVAWATAGLGLALVFGYYVVASVPSLRAQTAARNFHPTNFAGWDELDAAVREKLATMPANTSPSTSSSSKRAGTVSRRRHAKPSTRWPSAPSEAARLTAVVVLPTPPFWLVMASTFMSPLSG